MGIENFLGSGEELAVQRRIGEAAALASRDSDLPAAFVTQLFGRGVAEDLAGYEPAALAALAHGAWTFLAERRPGAPKLQFVPAAARDAPAILEILNDDMPFLVDSVLGELTERGLDIRLVLHPVFTVERDADGRLRDFQGLVPT